MGIISEMESPLSTYKRCDNMQIYERNFKKLVNLVNTNNSVSLSISGDTPKGLTMYFVYGGKIYNLCTLEKGAYISNETYNRCLSLLLQRLNIELPYKSQIMNLYSLGRMNGTEHTFDLTSLPIGTGISFRPTANIFDIIEVYRRMGYSLLPDEDNQWIKVMKQNFVLQKL